MENSACFASKMINVAQNLQMNRNLNVKTNEL